MKALLRSIKIAHTFARFRLDTLIPKQHLPTWMVLLLALMPWRWLIRANRPEAERFRLALEALGPIFIKFGQILSTRKDLLSSELANELSRLQDKVPPFASDKAKKLIEQALGNSTDEIFAQFEQTPLASASVAQVHAAKLKTGEDVVVKVIRPGIDKIIHQDLALLRMLAKLINLIPEGRRLKPIEVVEDYRSTVLDELDLMREAANSSSLRRNFLNSNLLYVPEVHWDYCRKNVLTMERIYGVPVADIETMRAAKMNFKLLAERGVEIFFTQVFRDKFFHADMHPGNIFVDITHPDDPTYIGIDCGIVGTLAEEDQHYLAQNLLAFFNRDYYKVAVLHVESGWVPKHTKVNEFESAIRSVCEPIFEKPLHEISFGQVLLRLFQTARRFEMEVQPQLVLLQKTLLNIEGLGRQLYPELDLWKTAKPYLENYIKERLGPKRAFKQIKERLPEWIEKAPYLPELIFKQLEAAQLNTQHQKAHLIEIQALKALEATKQRRRRWLAVGALVLVFAFVPSFDYQHWSHLQWLAVAIALFGGYKALK